jgi:hypothetical protein
MGAFLALYFGIIWMLCFAWWGAWTLDPRLHNVPRFSRKWWVLTIGMVVAIALWVYGLSLRSPRS